MSKKIEKYLGLAALTVAAVVIAGMFQSQVFAETSNKLPKANVGYYQTMDFFGSKVIVQDDLSTSAVLNYAGEGLLDAVCGVGGTAGSYTQVFDYATSVGVTIGSHAYALTPLVFTAAGTNAGADSACGPGCFCPPAPLKFKRGLVGVQNHAGHVTLFMVHSSTGANPSEF